MIFIYVYNINQFFVIEVLNEGKQWLDSWESNYDDGNITADEFLTQQTAEGLRVPIQFYIDITLYLLDECNFSYVMTSKTNQDNLEVYNCTHIFVLINNNIVSNYIYFWFQY